MSQQVNKIFEPMFRNPPRYVINMGGRGTGRSTASSQYAVAKLRDTTQYFRGAIMRLVAGDIRNSIYQDICDRLDDQGLDDVDRVENPLTFRYGHNKINGIGFKKSSGDQKSKLKSLAGYNCVIIEEADEISEEDFIQLDDSLRTLKSEVVIILNLNPPAKNHWIIKKWFNLVASEQEGFYIPKLKESCKHNTLFIMGDYRDNIANLSESTIANYENYRTTKSDHYWNMIRGYVSEGVRGRIYKNWKTCTNAVFNELPFTSTYYLDFGFTNDPTAFGEIKKHNEKVWVKELIHETGLTNPLISKRLEHLGISKNALIYADSAEPKSIKELQDLGWNIVTAEKGPDSVRAGIDMLLGFEVFYTEESTNIAIEQQEYKWALDKNKEPINEPVDKFNHHMDGIRYDVFTSSHEGFVGFV